MNHILQIGRLQITLQSTCARIQSQPHASLSFRYRCGDPIRSCASTSSDPTPDRPVVRPAVRLSPPRRLIPIATNRPFSSTVAWANNQDPSRHLPASLSTDSHHAAAKQWLEGFAIEDIPKNALEVTFARSSGPGGQVCLDIPLYYAGITRMVLI
jgi:hypothetical protein